MKKQCNFCGRNEREVKLLISGLNGFICDECASQAYQIVQQQQLNTGSQQNGKSKLKNIPKPKEIKEYLDFGGLYGNR